MSTLPIVETEKSPHSKMPMDPRTYERGLTCVHCGLCLPACPTYTETGHEADSPRGRIQLMLGLAEGKIEPTETVRKHLDLCLDCRGCETACPSGVIYHELIEETRARLGDSRSLPLQGRLVRWLFFNIFTRPSRLKLALLPARVLQKLGIYAMLRKVGMFGLLPLQLRKMEQMLPSRGPLWPVRLPEVLQPTNRASISTPTVGFFAGCIGSVLYDSVNRKAVELLLAGGAEVRVPRSQSCCGAIHHHNGQHDPAAEMARRNIDAFFPAKGDVVDWIVTDIAGCGAMLRDYPHLLRDDPDYAQRAVEFASKVRDISEVLLELPLPEPRHAIAMKATYHDACHLAHAQKVTAAPRALLAKISGLMLLPLPENDMCCGAAGTYNLEHPEMSTRLAHRKLANIATTGAELCITGNVGCAMQIQSQAIVDGRKLKVIHPVELLHAAVFGR